MRHRNKKLNIIFNALSWLFNKMKTKFNNFDIDIKNSKSDQIYAHAILLIEMLTNFKKKIIEKNKKDTT